MCKYTEAVCITVNKSKITFVNFKQTMKHLKLQQFVYFNKRIQYLILFYIIKQVINIYIYIQYCVITVYQKTFGMVLLIKICRIWLNIFLKKMQACCTLFSAIFLFSRGCHIYQYNKQEYHRKQRNMQVRDKNYVPHTLVSSTHS